MPKKLVEQNEIDIKNMAIRREVDRLRRILEKLHGECGVMGCPPSVDSPPDLVICHLHKVLMEFQTPLRYGYHEWLSAKKLRKELDETSPPSVTLISTSGESKNSAG